MSEFFETVVENGQTLSVRKKHDTMHIMWIIFELIFPLCHIIVSKNSDTMTIVVTFFGQHYFHNVDLRFASVNIMKIMLTKKSDTIVHSVMFF